MDLQKLPIELILPIANYLTPFELITAQTVCKRWHYIFSDKLILNDWKTSIGRPGEPITACIPCPIARLNIQIPSSHPAVAPCLLRDRLAVTHDGHNVTLLNLRNRSQEHYHLDRIRRIILTSTSIALLGEDSIKIDKEYKLGTGHWHVRGVCDMFVVTGKRTFIIEDGRMDVYNICGSGIVFMPGGIYITGKDIMKIPRYVPSEFSEPPARSTISFSREIDSSISVRSGTSLLGRMYHMSRSDIAFETKPTRWVLTSGSYLVDTSATDSSEIYTFDPRLMQPGDLHLQVMTYEDLDKLQYAVWKVGERCGRPIWVPWTRD